MLRILLNIYGSKSANNLSGSFNKLKDTSDDLFQDFFDTDKFTNFIQDLDIIVGLIDKLVERTGALPPILATIAGYKLLKGRSTFEQLGTAVETISKLKTMAEGDFTPNVIEGMANAVKNLSAQQQAAVLSSQGLTKAQIAEALTMNGVATADTAAALARTGMVTATQNLTMAEFESVVAQQTGNVEMAQALVTELGLSVAENGRLVGLEAVTEAELLAAASQAGLNASQTQGIATALGYTTTTNVLSLSLKGLAIQAKTAGKALLGLAKAHPVILAIAAAVAIGTTIVVHYNKVLKEADEVTKSITKQRKEDVQSLKKEVDELSELSDQYEKLSKKVSLTESDKSQLQTIQDKLSESYDAESRKIDVVNGKYDEQIKKIKKLKKEKQDLLVEGAVDDIKTIDRDFASEEQRQKDWSGFMGDNAAKVLEAVQTTFDEKYTAEKELDENLYNWYTQFNDTIKDDAAKFEKYGLKYTHGDNGEPVYLPIYGFEEDSSIEQRKAYYEDLYKYLTENASVEEKDTYFYAALKKDLETKIKDFDKLLAQRNKDLESIGKQYVETPIEVNGKQISADNVTADQVKYWKSEMIKQFATDKFGNEDPIIVEAIETWIGNNFDAVSAGNEVYYFAKRTKDELDGAMSEVFDFSTWADENGFSDFESRMDKLRSAYSKLNEGKSGISLGNSFFKDFPDLAVYANDTERLQQEMQKLANTEKSALINQLSNLFINAKDSESENAIRTVIRMVQDVSDITSDIAYNYSEQKTQIQKNIEVIENEISRVEKLKKKQEEHKKILEKERKVLEDQKSVLQKQRENVEKMYKKQIDAIDEEIDKLREEADEQDRINDLKEKELALEKAKNTKVRRYDSARGWVIILPINIVICYKQVAISVKV